MSKYSVNGLPSDLISGEVEGARRLKVEAIVLDPESTPESGLIQKSFTYNPDGTIATLTELNLNTNVSILKTFSYDENGNCTSITPQIL